MDDDDQLEKRVASILWYHEFDFPNGLKARSQSPHAEGHRTLWAFIRKQLDNIDFAGKTVLDVGCWDGMWSFYAERRNAKHVLASDDASQNWLASAGIHVARELFNSSIEVDLQRSIYDLTSLNRKFDIVLCMGVYYHLHDPFYGFAQIRHCCHDETIVVFEGDVTDGLKANTAMIDFSNRYPTIFIPTAAVLNEMLEATYLKVEAQNKLFPQQAIGRQNSVSPPRAEFRMRLPWKSKKKIESVEKVEKLPESPDSGLPPLLNRIVTIARPFSGENRLHMYPPPFGLARYDSRFGQTASATSRG